MISYSRKCTRIHPHLFHDVTQKSVHRLPVILHQHKIFGLSKHNTSNRKMTKAKWRENATSFWAGGGFPSLFVGLLSAPVAGPIAGHSLLTLKRNFVPGIRCFNRVFCWSFVILPHIVIMICRILRANIAFTFLSCGSLL